MVWVKASGSNAQNGTTTQNGQRPTYNGNQPDENTGNNDTAQSGNAAAGNSTDRAARRNAYNRQAQSGNSSNRTAASGFPSGNMPIGNSKNAGYYSNAVLKIVEVGISNETYTEIISGLIEGETVVLPAATASSTTTTTNGNRNGFGGVMRMSGASSGGFVGRPD
jgi:HlyD family secretion protein